MMKTNRDLIENREIIMKKGVNIITDLDFVNACACVGKNYGAKFFQKLSAESKQHVGRPAAWAVMYTTTTVLK